MFNINKKDKTVHSLLLAVLIIIGVGLDSPSKSINQLQYLIRDPGRGLNNLREIMGRMSVGYSWQIQMYSENFKLLEYNNPESLVQQCSDSIQRGIAIDEVGQYQKVINSSIIIDLPSSSSKCLSIIKQYEHNLDDINIVQKRLDKLKNFDMSKIQT
jgi:hypothetical protein